MPSPPLGHEVWRERPLIILGMVGAMGAIELTVGRERYGAYDAEPGKLGDFWQTARPEDPKVGCRLVPIPTAVAVAAETPAAGFELAARGV